MKYIFTYCMILWCCASISSQSAINPVHPGITLEKFATPRAGSTSILIFGKGAQENVLSMPTPYRIQPWTLTHQSFFCRIESQIERRSRIAPRFRLGSLDYTNWLEGKGNLRE
ncbi:MAG TPA: hypothetical protein VI603_18295 [Saprospiraceae bacterium]|nr:hypothetical protein [Saprospiraceae bacterium]